MIKLRFPHDDPRLYSVSKERPWLFHGAKGQIVSGVKRLMTEHVVLVQFDGAPKGDYDLVSPEFVKMK